jgi:hypothetical protein
MKQPPDAMLAEPQYARESNPIEPPRSDFYLLPDMEQNTTVRPAGNDLPDPLAVSIGLERPPWAALSYPRDQPGGSLHPPANCSRSMEGATDKLDEYDRACYPGNLCLTR